jgi:hypothetical protein
MSESLLIALREVGTRTSKKEDVEEVAYTLIESSVEKENDDDMFYL